MVASTFLRRLIAVIEEARAEHMPCRDNLAQALMLSTKEYCEGYERKNPNILTMEERDALSQVPMQKIQAIKSYRERIGCGLKEAKDAVEQLGSVLLGRVI
jgi:ribosomal protein L7/L12